MWTTMPEDTQVRPTWLPRTSFGFFSALTYQRDALGNDAAFKMAKCVKAQFDRLHADYPKQTFRAYARHWTGICNPHDVSVMQPSPLHQPHRSLSIKNRESWNTPCMFSNGEGAA